MKKILSIFFVGLLIISGIGAGGLTQKRSIKIKVDEYDMLIIAQTD